MLFFVCIFIVKERIVLYNCFTQAIETEVLMHYDYSLIHMTNTLESLDTMYSIICLKATRLSILLNGTKCYLDGKYMLCLSQDDTLSVGGG